MLYQTIEEMVGAVRASAKDSGAAGTTFCSACFEGNYPTGDITESMLSDIE